jgi:hypothetical protein
LNLKATYKGEPIKILERVRETPDHGVDHMLKVELLDGKETVIDLKDIKFKFNLKEEE